ncbi:hypothetical protein [Kribbella sp. NPDC049227]|uniref:hypothetical protein n=1 Tax=Kribbella sp. NPDC049227 TaxID=3364113 RepID=UPI003719292F
MTGQHAPWYQPFMPPNIEAATWRDAMNNAAWQCECTGQCGRAHLKTLGRCGAMHSTAHRLAVVTTDPLAPLTDAVNGAGLTALCAPCDTAIHRAAKTARNRAETAQPDLFEITRNEAA